MQCGAGACAVEALLVAVLPLTGCASARPSAAPLSPTVGIVEVRPAPEAPERERARASLPAGAEPFQRACELGSARSCNALAVKLLDGTGVTKDEPRAVALLERGCELKLPMACFNLGYTAASGRGMVQDSARAAELYEFGCTGKIGEACNALGDLLKDAETPDAKRALVFFEKGCELKATRGCVNAGGLHYFGNGTARDQAKAGRYYRLACDADVGLGCAGLATMVLLGEGGLVADPLSAMDLYEKGCRLDTYYGCYTYGLALSNGSLGAPDVEHAEPALRSACDAGNAEACAALDSLLDSDE